MKPTVLLSAFVFVMSFVASASLVNNGAQIVVKANSFVNLTSGDFVNKSSGSSHGAVTLDGTIKLGGDWTNSATSGAVFEPESAGTVVFSGTAQTIAGATSFPNLTKGVSSADTLTFSSGTASRTSVTGTLTLQGASGQLLSLRSSNSGTQWELDPQGTRTLGYLDVRDSKNVNASVIDVHGENCSDSGNNTNWLFTQETTYTVTFTAGANGTISGQTTQTVISGDDCSAVTAVPANGYHFVNWTGSSTSTNNPLTITNVTSNMNFTANFEANPVGQYTVTFLAGSGGSITGTASQTVDQGADCSPVTAVPSSGYNFSGWTGSHTGSENPLTITNVQQDMTITANFAVKTYTVIFAAGSGGTLTGTTTQTVSHGGTCSAVTAIPNPGYNFVNWTGTATSTGNPLTVTNVSSDMNFTANFAAASYTVTFTAGSGGTLTGTTTQTVAHGGNCTAVTAVPDSGYSFAGWAGDYGGNENPLTVSNVIANMSINANFSQITYNVVFTAGANGSISGTANQTVAKGGSSSPVTAVPADGYHFAGWTGDHVGTENPLTVINVQANKTITANFEQNAADQFTVTFIAGTGGTISGTASQTVNSGGDCNAVTAVPDTGYSFTGWAGDHSGTENPLTIRGVSKNMIITAGFAIKTYTVSFSAGANGTINGTATQTIDHGGDCSAVTAVPDDGYSFVNWTGSATSTSNPLTVTNVSSDMNFTANFAVGTYTVTFTAGNGGSLTGTTPQTVVQGGNCSAVTAVPNDGYEFISWSGDYSGDSNPLAITNVVKNMTINANFAVITYDVTFTAGLNGYISGTTAQTVAYGGDCTPVTAVPGDGYHFVDWTGDYSGTENPLTIKKIQKNMVVTANFEQNAADQFTVTFIAGGGGSISGTASQVVNSGGDCTAVTAVPNAGNSFIDWTGDHEGSENPLTITGVVANMKINANFAAQTFTVVFTSGAGGTLTGDTEQTVSYGDDCTAVTATPGNGYYFSGWSGDHSGKTNPLTITDVSTNMAITANFAQKPAGQFVLSFTAGANGAISGESSQLIVSGGNGSPVTAVPADGYRFQNWTGSATSADNPFAVSNVLSDMNFTANFVANPPGFFTVTFVPGENGSISGETSQVVADGADCTQVTALPIGGYSFIGWTGNYTGTTNPLVIQDVSEDMIITANFAIPSNQFACGKFHSIKPSDIEHFEGGKFIKSPSVKAIYDDPFNAKKTDQKATMKVLNKMSAKIPAGFADCEWIKKVKLYDLKKWSKAKTCGQNMEANPISPLFCEKVLVSVTDMEKNKLVNVEIGQAVLRPPYINKVTNSYGANISSAGAAETIYIEGTFFGKTAPKVWLEYPVYEKDGETVKQIKGLAMKIQKPYIYPNYKNDPGKSCMDIESGVSRIAVVMPKFPKKWIYEIPHNIVIDNKVGRATWEFGTK